MIVGIFSDAHGHEAGYLSARETLRALGAQRLFYLGDAVGYIPSPGVIRHLFLDDIPWLKGNHEAMLLAANNPPDREVEYRHSDVRAQLSREELGKLEALPISLQRKLDGRTCLFVHGSPTDPTFAYVYPDTDLSQFLQVEADTVFLGNTHRPFVRRKQGKLFVNVGSCGLPRDDSGFGCAALYDTATHEAKLLKIDLSDGSQELLSRFDLAPAVTEILERTIRTSP